MQLELLVVAQACRTCSALPPSNKANACNAATSNNTARQTLKTLPDTVSRQCGDTSPGEILSRAEPGANGTTAGTTRVDPNLESAKSAPQRS